MYLTIFRRDIEKIIADILDAEKDGGLVVVSSSKPGEVHAVKMSGKGRTLSSRRGHRTTRKPIRNSKGRKTRKTRARQSHA